MNDQDREAFEAWAETHGWRLGRESMAEDAWLAALAHARKQTAELVEAVEAYILELDGSLITPMLCVNKIEGAVKRLAQLKEQDDEQA